MIVNIIAKTTASITVILYDLANLIAHATGMTIIDDTIRAPTVLDAIATVRAVNIVNIKFIVLTGIPTILAPLSSKAICISSLYRAIKATITNIDNITTRDRKSVV